MSRKPKPKNQLSAGQRAALYAEEQENRRRAMSQEQVEMPKDPAEDSEAVARQVAKKVLPKPQHAVINVDFSIPAGKIKALSGMCNGPASFDSDISPLFKNMRVPYVRYNDTDTAVSRYAFDISRIFPTGMPTRMIPQAIILIRPTNILWRRTTVEQESSTALVRVIKAAAGLRKTRKNGCRYAYAS